MHTSSYDNDSLRLYDHDRDNGGLPQPNGRFLGAATGNRLDKALTEGRKRGLRKWALVEFVSRTARAPSDLVERCIFSS